MTADLEREHGVKALAWSANGMRMFSSNKPLRRMEDFRGFRLRMPNIPNYIAFGKALGANVTPMPISEVFYRAGTGGGGRTGQPDRDASGFRMV